MAGMPRLAKKPTKSFLAHLVKIESEKGFGTGCHNSTKLQGSKIKIQVN
jgi:hypothetical protein